MSTLGDPKSSLVDGEAEAEPEYKVSLAEFEAKYSNKQEVWRYVAVDMDGYVPKFK